MGSIRGSSGAEPSRGERSDAAARRLAQLAADLGATEPAAWPPQPVTPDPDVTRVTPARRAVPLEPGPVEGVMAPPEPPILPRPGRHAARRLGVTPRLPALPGLMPAHLAVLALVVAAGVGLAAWWAVRDQAVPMEPGAVRPAESVQPLVPAGGEASARPVDAGGTVTVDVTGRVRRPGIVVLDAGARVVDALEAAGGERRGVDLSTLNLARVLVDGEQIVVGGPPAVAPVAPSGSAAPGAPTTLVNLNTATQAELETLPDIGPVTAAAILAWRDEHGGFTSIDELLEVSGIGEATLSTVAPYVTV